MEVCFIFIFKQWIELSEHADSVNYFTFPGQHHAENTDRLEKWGFIFFLLVTLNDPSDLTGQQGIDLDHSYGIVCKEVLSPR